VIEVIVAKFPFQDPNLAGVRNTVEWPPFLFQPVVNGMEFLDSNAFP
jgi:hypothetical protein